MLALVTVALWSTVATGFKLGLERMAPLQLLWLASLVSLVFFAAAAVVQRFRTGPTPNLAWRDYGYAAALGLLNPFGYYAVLFAAYDRLPAQIAQPLNFTWAITLTLLAVPVLKQRLGHRELFGIVISYAGVVVVLTGGSATNMMVDALGVALALGSTLLWATYWLANVRIKLPPERALLLAFAAGTPLVGIACVMTSGLPEPSPANLTYGLWVGLVEMGIAFLTWQVALRSTRHAGRLAQLVFLAPFISLLFIARFVGEAIQPSAVVGLALIVAGLVTGRLKSPVAPAQ